MFNFILGFLFAFVFIGVVKWFRRNTIKVMPKDLLNKKAKNKGAIVL